MNDTKEVVSFERTEKTVLVDAINWYLEQSEDSLFIEELPKDKKETLTQMKDDLNEKSSCKFDSELSSFVINEIIPKFGQELKEQIGLRKVENKEKTGDFYRVQFESINEKLELLQKEQNPFY